jgi:heme-degrading monooxygenase HmoA
MITEIAQIDVKPGTEKDFEAAVAKARPLFLRAKGGKGFELHKSIEKPSRYRLMAKWETLENHTVDFRGSEDFTAWRGAGRAVFCGAPGGRTHRDGADHGGITRLQAAVGSGAASSALK